MTRPNRPSFLPSVGLLAALACLPGVPVAAQQALTLEQLEELALENNPTLAQVRHRIAASEATARQAGMWPNVHLAYATETINRHESHGGVLRQIIPISGRLGADQAVHDQDAAVGRLVFDEQRYRVLNQIHKLYRSVLISGAEVELQEDVVALIEEELETIRQLANIGLEDRLDVLEKEMALEHARLDLNEKRLEHRHKTVELAMTVGDPELSEMTLAGDPMELPGEVDYDAGLARLLDESPELAVANALVARHGTLVQREEIESRPDLGAAFGYRYNRGGENIIGHDSFVPAEWEVFLELDLSLPIWNRNQHGAQAEREEMMEAEEDLRRKRLHLREEWDDVHHGYVVEHDEARVFRDEILTRAEEVHALALARYEDYGEHYGEVLEARGKVLEVRGSVLESLDAAWGHYIMLEGFLLAGGIMSPNLHMLPSDKATTFR